MQLPIIKERKFIVTTVSGQQVEVHRRKDNLFFEGQPVAFITPEITGTVHIFTGYPIGQRFPLNRYIVSGSTFWDILYDVPPTKEYAGQVQALLMQFQLLSQFFLLRMPEQPKE